MSTRPRAPLGALSTGSAQTKSREEMLKEWKAKKQSKSSGVTKSSGKSKSERYSLRSRQDAKETAPTASKPEESVRLTGTKRAAKGDSPGSPKRKSPKQSSGSLAQRAERTEALELEIKALRSQLSALQESLSERIRECSDLKDELAVEKEARQLESEESKQTRLLHEATISVLREEIEEKEREIESQKREHSTYLAMYGKITDTSAAEEQNVELKISANEYKDALSSVEELSFLKKLADIQSESDRETVVKILAEKKCMVRENIRLREELVKARQSSSAIQRETYDLVLQLADVHNLERKMTQKTITKMEQVHNTRENTLEKTKELERRHLESMVSELRKTMASERNLSTELMKRIEERMVVSMQDFVQKQHEFFTAVDKM